MGRIGSRRKGRGESNDGKERGLSPLSSSHHSFRPSRLSLLSQPLTHENQLETAGNEPGSSRM